MEIQKLGKILILFAVWFHLALSYEEKSVEFLQDLNMDNRTVSTSTSSTKCRSRIHCAGICLEDTVCRSFFFNPASQKCILSSERRVDRLSTIEENGWSYYYSKMLLDYTTPVEPSKEFSTIPQSTVEASTEYSTFPQSTAPKNYTRMCYYTNWSQYRTGDGKFLPEDINAFLCTHIMFAFAELDGNTLTNYEWNDPDSGGTQGLYSRVMNLRDANPSLKVILTVGGANAPSLDFSQMVSTQTNRQAFINSARQFLRQHRFDGLDMDWEYPTQRGGAAADFTNFGLLIQELRSEFDVEAITTGNDRLILTVAVPPAQSLIDGSYDVPTISANVDYIGVMAYNFYGSWNTETGHNSPLYPTSASVDQTLSMSYAVGYWFQLGVPKDKIIVGMAAYGRSFTLSDPGNYGVGAPTVSGSAPSGPFTGEAGFLSYYEICQKQQSGAGDTYRDTNSQVPYYVDGTTWISFDDEISIYNKVKNFIIPQGYAGAMIWALPLDDFKPLCGTVNYPLVKKIKEAFDEETANG